MSQLYQIAIKTSLRRLFTYESSEELLPGVRVRVPFRSKERVGVVWAEANEAPKGLKTVLGAIDQRQIFSAETLAFFEFSAQYYGTSLGDLLQYSLPKKIREGAEIIPAVQKSYSPKLPNLNEQQKKAVKEILDSKNFSSHLLLGETGSGKTEVYLQLMKNVLESGGQVLMLVPEISLTPQLESRLSERLGDSVSLYHSNLKESLRLKTFSSAESGQADVFLGARSALFLPFKNLKLIVVDEEHDASYKQSERSSYQARDLAIYRAKLSQIPIVLGSATPSIETYHRAKLGQSSLIRMQKFHSTPRSELEIIDLKKVWETEEKSFISQKLHQRIEECLEKNEQSLIFLNRRGSASQRICTQCGLIDECKHCSTKLTLHFDSQMAICHLCGYQEKIKKDCSGCGSKEFFVGGIGTKEVEALLQERFPEARIARLDRDQTQKRNALNQIIHEFSKGEIDILVGTQMISKGIDIERLSLLGVVLADQGWSVPDFRALERSYQLMHQLFGRVGRRGQASRCVVQTFSPEHPLFSYLQGGKSFEDFASSELELRQKANLPPFSRFFLILLSHRDYATLNREASELRLRLASLAKTLDVELLGPVDAPLSKMKNLYRIQVLAKSSEVAKLSAFQNTLLDDLERNPLQSRVSCDRDPQSFM